MIYEAVTGCAVAGLVLVSLLGCHGPPHVDPAVGQIRTVVQADGSGSRLQTITFASNFGDYVTGGISGVVGIVSQAAPSLAVVGRSGLAVTVAYTFRSPDDLAARARQVTRTAGPSLVVGGTPFSQGHTYREVQSLEREFDWILSALLTSPAVRDDLKNGFRQGDPRFLGDVLASVVLPGSSSDRQVAAGEQVTTRRTYEPERIVLSASATLERVTRRMEMRFDPGTLGALVREQGNQAVVTFLATLAPGSPVSVGLNTIVLDLADRPAPGLFTTLTSTWQRDEHAPGDVRVLVERVKLGTGLGVLPKTFEYRVVAPSDLEYSPQRKLHGEGMRRVVKTSGADGGSATVSGNTLAVVASGTAEFTAYARIVVERGMPPQDVPTMLFAVPPLLGALVGWLIVLALAGLSPRGWPRSLAWSGATGIFLALVPVTATIGLTLLFAPALVPTEHHADSDLGDAIAQAGRDAWRLLVPLGAAAAGTAAEVDVTGRAEGDAFTGLAQVMGGFSILVPAVAASVYGRARRRATGLAPRDVMVMGATFIVVATGAPFVAGALLPRADYSVGGDVVFQTSSTLASVNPVVAALLAVAVPLAAFSTADWSFRGKFAGVSVLVAATTRAVLFGSAVVGLVPVLARALAGLAHGGFYPDDNILPVLFAPAFGLQAISAAGSLGDPFDEATLATVADPPLYMAAGAVLIVAVAEVAFRSRRRVLSKVPSARIGAAAVGCTVAAWLLVLAALGGFAAQVLSEDYRYPTFGAQAYVSFAGAIGSGLAVALVFALRSTLASGVRVPAVYGRAGPAAALASLSQAAPPGAVARYLPRSLEMSLVWVQAGLALLLLAFATPVVSVSVSGAAFALSLHDLREGASLFNSMVALAESLAKNLGGVAPATVAAPATLPREIQELQRPLAALGVAVQLGILMPIATVALLVYAEWRDLSMRVVAFRASVALAALAVLVSIAELYVYTARVAPAVADLDRQATSLLPSLKLSVGLQMGILMPLLAAVALGAGGLAGIRSAQATSAAPRPRHGDPEAIAVAGLGLAVVALFLPWQRNHLDVGALGQLIQLPDLGANALGIQAGWYGLAFLVAAEAVLFARAHAHRLDLSAQVRAALIPTVGAAGAIFALFLAQAEIGRGVLARGLLEQAAGALGGVGSLLAASGIPLSGNSLDQLSKLIRVDTSYGYYLFIVGCVAMLAPLVPLASDALRASRTAPPIATTTAQPTTPGAARFCGQCGASRTPGARFCPICGAPLQ